MDSVSADHEGANATLPNSGSVTLLVTELQALIATNRTLHDVVLELKDLLRDPARTVRYPTPRLVVTPADISRPPSPNKPVSGSRKLTRDDPYWSEVVQVVSLGEGDDTASKQGKEAFFNENEQARERHQERRTREMARLKSKVSYKCK